MTDINDILNPQPENIQEKSFEELVEAGKYHLAAEKAEQQNIRKEKIYRTVEQELKELLSEEERLIDNPDENVKKAYSLLDSFNYDKTTKEFVKKQFYNPGEEQLQLQDLKWDRRMIDNVAQEVYRRLDLENKALFAYHQENSIARINQKPEEVAMRAYEQAESQEQYDVAEKIKDRFNLDL